MTYKAFDFITTFIYSYEKLVIMKKETPCDAPCTYQQNGKCKHSDPDFDGAETPTGWTEVCLTFDPIEVRS